VVAENGVGRTTHRAVAARAGLPLGATTYYYPTLDDLIAAGLRHALDALQTELQAWDERLSTAPDVPEALTQLVQEYLADRRQVRIEYELFVAAARDRALRPLAEAWLNDMPEALVTTVGPAKARDICALLDGFILQALVSDTELDTERLTSAIRKLSS
ncbi:TetR/AcrR family transcriptional regulator, partial [Actinoplanes philippinensis]|uniref:TetR/AcrR family transcriptional regulator n=1 Tax=Actinoplanes philippinensis TaxID=35752 RepID=UPI0033D6B3F3